MTKSRAVEKLRSREVQEPDAGLEHAAAREAAEDSSTPELLDFSTFLTNEPRMSMKTKEEVKKSDLSKIERSSEGKHRCVA